MPEQMEGDVDFYETRAEFEENAERARNWSSYVHS